MACHHSSSSETSRRRRRTSLGYRTFACRACRTVFNERTGTPFNDLQHPTDLVLLTVLWRLRYKLSFRDVAVLLLQRGFEVTHETVREWEFRFACWARIFDRERSGEHWRAVRSCSYVAVPGSVRIARMNIAAPRPISALAPAEVSGRACYRSGIPTEKPATRTYRRTARAAAIDGFLREEALD